jgi:hypothetical protein
VCTWGRRRGDSSRGMTGNRKFNILKSLQYIVSVNKWWSVRWAREGVQQVLGD